MTAVINKMSANDLMGDIVR